MNFLFATFWVCTTVIVGFLALSVATIGARNNLLAVLLTAFIFGTGFLGGRLL